MADISIEQIAQEIVTALEASLIEAWNKTSEPDSTKRAVYKAWEQVDIVERIKNLAVENKVKPYNPLTLLGAEGGFGVDKSWLLNAKDAEYLKKKLIGSPVISEAEKKGRPMPAQRFQEQEILRVINELKLDAKKLPVNKPGQPGVKSKVRGTLNDPMWTDSVFKHAWERLRKNGDISDR